MSPPTTATPCTIEVFNRSVPGQVKIWYWVSETDVTTDQPNPDPVSIIAWDQPFNVHYKIQLTDALRRHFCGKLCVDVDIDTCGPSPDYEFDELEFVLDPCGSGIYEGKFVIPANTLKPKEGKARCGRVYRLCITVGSHDACGKPGLIWGHCDEVTIAVHPPVPA